MSRWYACYWNALLFMLNASPQTLHVNLSFTMQIYLQQFRTGWPHSSPNKIPPVFFEFSLCYRNFPHVIFTQKPTIGSMNKGHITTILLDTEAYKLCG